MLLALSFAVAIASIVQDFRYDLSSTRQHTATLTMEREVGSLDLAVANLRAAQAAYVAAGQGPDFWMKRASDLSSEIEIRINSLQAVSASPEARAHYDAALAALGSLAALDKKARHAIDGGERLQASDVIFMDSAESTQHLSSELQAARDAELAAGSDALAAVRTSRLRMNGGALAIALAVGLFLLQRVRVAAPVPEPAPAPVAAPALEPDLDQTFTRARIAPGVNLKAAAEVCVDLARVIDGRDVQPLLERAAKVLEAKGLILWVLDESGALLRPSLAYGYSDKVMQRLGGLETAADNPTSQAFRSMQAQVVPGPGVGSTGAIAAPLVTPSGCVGVLAAEVSRPNPGEDTLSVARMFAAQLATFVAPVPGATTHAAQA